MAINDVAEEHDPARRRPHSSRVDRRWFGRHAPGGERVAPGRDVGRLVPQSTEDGTDVCAVLVGVVERLGEEHPGPNSEDLVVTPRLTEALVVPVAGEEPL